MNYHILPKNNAGSIEHYYHFLFGYLLPFIQNTDHFMNSYYFDNCGPMNRHILDLPISNLRILTPSVNIDKKLSYRGYDDDYIGMNLSIIRQKIYSIFNIDQSIVGEEILLIDRDKPDSFYLTKAKIKNSGASRRHIPNIDDILNSLIYKLPTIKKIYLENMSLYDQIILFKKAKIIICQHGASMSNLIWCNPNTQIIEIRTRSNSKCYNPIMDMCNLKHTIIPQKHIFAPVNPQEILNLIT